MKFHIIFWILFIAFMFPSAKFLRTPLVALLGVLGIIALTSRNENNRGY